MLGTASQRVRHKGSITLSAHCTTALLADTFSVCISLTSSNSLHAANDLCLAVPGDSCHARRQHPASGNCSFDLPIVSAFSMYVIYCPLACS